MYYLDNCLVNFVGCVDDLFDAKMIVYTLWVAFGNTLLNVWVWVTLQSYAKFDGFVEYIHLFKWQLLHKMYQKYLTDKCTVYMHRDECIVSCVSRWERLNTFWLNML